jgi:hypothetical protein
LIRRPGSARVAALAALAALAASASASCLPYGFVGGGLPSNVKTVAVLPFENQTPMPELQRELYDVLRRDVEGRLGLRDASESRADAVVRGTILRYEPDLPIAFSSDPNRATSARRKLQIVVDVQIVDQTSGKPLWQRQGLTVEGEYNERQEAQGRRDALRKLVDQVVEGAQSQW